MSEIIAVIGLGYVGLPVALAFAAKFPGTIGFDIDSKRIESLREGRDWTGEMAADELRASPIRFTGDERDLQGATLFIVCVPTPIDREKRPDLGPLRSASEIAGRNLKPGALVIYESTVYPGCTEDFCGSILEQVSGLKRPSDFKVGYSPERINPGDKTHTLTRITKIVSAEDEESAQRAATAYGAIIEAGIYRAPSIRVAEAAKIIENTQRDLNIALINELAVIFDRLGIRTQDVLDAAATKWNFLKFTPGLVGGHCIGVDPYYLTAKAESVGYHPHVILAGRRINDSMGMFIASKVLQMLSTVDIPLSKTRVGILGLTFKENVRDLRNSRVPDIVRELKLFGVNALVADPVADPKQALHEFGIELIPVAHLRDLHAVVLTVPHRELLVDTSRIFAALHPGAALIDVKSAIHPRTLPDGIRYWSL